MNKEYKYKFSVIMCIYNVDKYLEEAIESIINQDIGFEDNIQLILVNDGSLDNSENICLKYKNKYPNNIKYLKKENGGLASAKNYGLDYIEGKYINFFDSDDTLPINVFKCVNMFFKKNELCVDFVCVPLYFFEAEHGLHPKYSYMGKKNRIINLNEEPYNFVLSGASSFYKREIFDNFRFDETYKGEEDTLLNGLIYKKNPRFGYVCENGVKYNYRKRKARNSIGDMVKENPESYYTVLKLLQRIINKKNVSEYEKEIIIYELRSRLKSINKKLFKDTNEYNYIIDSYKKIISKIDINYIIYHSKFCSTMELKVLFSKFIDKKFSMNKYSLDFKRLLSMSKIEIVYFKIMKNNIIIKTKYQTLGEKSIDVVVFDENNNITYPSNKQTFSSFYDLKVGEFEIDNTHIATFSLDIKKIKKIKFILYDVNEETYIPPRNVNILNSLPFASTLKRIKYKNYQITYNGRIFIIDKFINKKSCILKQKIKELKEIYHVNKSIALYRLFSKRKKNYILINDRLNKGNDNGEALFRYINKFRPEISKYTYFVISKKSQDFKRLKKIGKVVNTYSWLHKILFLNAGFIYSSHTMPEYFNAFHGREKQNCKDLFNYKFVWLQHGITQNDISKASNKYRKNIDCVVTATYDEKQEFMQEKYGFDNKDIILTGFSRYDLLNNKEENIISIIPTWRRGLGTTDVKELKFKETQFYKSWCSLLNNSDLYKICKNNNLIIKFILHPEMVNYKSEFTVLSNDVIKIYDPSEINYTEIFNSSKLLITDYSSVFFDFAYLKKPIIYYQFDKDFFWSKHYVKGYFNFEEKGFGNVIEKESVIVDKIKEYIKNNFKMEDKYIKRVDATFKYNDKNNCKRIIEKTYR